MAEENQTQTTTPTNQANDAATTQKFAQELKVAGTSAAAVLQIARHLNWSEDVHKKTFWVGLVGAGLAIAGAFGLPIDTQQASMLQDGAGVLIAMVLGGSAVSVVHAHAAAKIAGKAGS